MVRNVSILVATLAACGGAPKPTEKAPASVAFRDLNADQRMAFMKETVMPAMTKTFVAFDAKHFGDVTCKVCHGKGADDGDFEMPNPDLPRLPDEAHFPAFAQDPKHAPWVKFMIEQVTPQMADLLHEKRFDMATKTGFSCHACHLVEGQEAAPHDHEHHH